VSKLSTENYLEGNNKKCRKNFSLAGMDSSHTQKYYHRHSQGNQNASPNHVKEKGTEGTIFTRMVLAPIRNPSYATGRGRTDANTRE